MTDTALKMLRSAAAGRYLYDGFDARPGSPGEVETEGYKTMAALIEAGFLGEDGRITETGLAKAREAS